MNARQRKLALFLIASVLCIVAVVGSIFRFGPRGRNAPQLVALTTDERSTSVPESTETVASAPQQATQPLPTLDKPEEREIAVFEGPHGRVVEHGSRIPVPGLVVRLRKGSSVLAEAETDANGCFAFPSPDRKRPSVELAGDRWRSTPSSIRLDDDQASGRSALEFEVERIVATPVLGRIYDRQSGEAIPAFWLIVSGPRPKLVTNSGDVERDEDGVTFSMNFEGLPRKTESIVSDADGRFATHSGFEAGELRIQALDVPSEVRRSEPFEESLNFIEHEHRFPGEGPAQAVEIGLAIGPTYTVELELPEGLRLEDLHAAFPRRSSGLRGLHRMAAEDRGSPVSQFFGAIADPNVLEEKAPLRGGTPIWVRFRSPIFPEEPPTSQQLDLHVRSDDGYWSGSATVASIVGIQPGVLHIELQPRGAIEGKVVDPQGNPVPTAWIQRLAPAQDDEPIAEVGADENGAFRFAWLDSGLHDLRVKCERYGSWQGRVETHPGETLRLDVVLTPQRTLGSVTGRLRSRTGQHRSKGAVVSLASTTDPELSFLRTISYRDIEGELVAPFEFDKIPEGDYELKISPLDNRRWDALRKRVTVPAQDVEFTCIDDAPTFALEFSAIDGLTGASIEGLSTIVWHGAPADELRLDDDWKTKRYLGVPEESPLSWVARAEGFGPVWGDASAIPVQGDVRVVVVRLEPGWGHIYKVTTPDQKPIEGVALLVNGELIGHSDAQGLIAISLSKAPSTLEFRLEGWRVTWGRVDPTESDFGRGLETPVYMKQD